MRRVEKGGSALAVLLGIFAAPLALPAAPAGAIQAATGATYTPSTPVLATIANGTAAAPWNLAQGDPGTTASPDTPGPLTGYCGTGNNTSASGGTPQRQPAGTTLPFAPAYFPHVIRNADGSLTGYFDYRPQDADEALVAATSTDGGKSWTYDGEALEQNPGYCPTADINDDGQGHANIVTVGGNSYLYTLARAAGDMPGVGMIVHQFNPTPASPLGSGPHALPAAEKVGIDPDAFATGSPVAIPASGGTAVTVPVTSTGTANSPEQLITGSFIDLTQDPTQGPADVINCSVTLGVNSLSSCTMNSTSAMTVNPAFA